MKKSQTKVRVDFIIYCHYAVNNSEDDIKKDKEGNGISNWPVIKKVRDKSEQIVDLLYPEEDNTMRGMAMLFFDPGWKEVLSGRQPLTEDTSAYARRVKGEIKNVFLAAQGNQPVGERQSTVGNRLFRVITAQDLEGMVKNLTEREQASIYRWLVGEEGQRTYDSPKIVEAIIRLRLIGSDIPVFRVDHDVLLPDSSTSGTGFDNKAISKMVRAYRKRSRDLTMIWMFSAGYDTTRAEGENTYDVWSRAFATRVQPVLAATPDVCNLVYGKNFGLLLEKTIEIPRNVTLKSITDCVESAFSAAFDKGLVHRYYGLRENKVTENTQPTGVAKYGPGPLSAVISGALLNISISAIDALPPFSNFGLGVMWIDDYLKFALHEELGHFTRLAVRNIRPRERVTVTKGRQPPSPNLTAYTWGSYLPVLLRGIIMDYWIRGKSGGKGVLTEEIEQATKTGKLTPRRSMVIGYRLRAAALERIDEISKEWSGLIVSQSQETLVSAWVKGRVEELVMGARPAGDLTPTDFDRSSRACGLIRPDLDGRSRNGPIGWDDLNKGIQDDIETLILDAVDYIHLTISWGGIIQTVRSQPVDSLPVDIGWGTENA